MAFDPTILLEARATIEQATKGKITQNELRIPYFGAAKSFLQGANGLIPGLAELKKSSEQVTKIPVFQKISAGGETARRCAGSGTGTTAFVTPTWQGITEHFSLSELEHARNMVGKDKAFTYLLSQKTKAMYGRINTICLAYLESNKSTVNDGNYFATTVANAKQVSQAQKDDFFAGIKAEMAANDFYGMTEVVAGFNLEVLYNKLMNQGAQNATNQAFTVSNFLANFTSITNGSGVLATSYAFEPGTVGLFPWINALHRKGAENGTDVWTTFRLPAMPGMDAGLEVELKVKKSCEDNSGSITGGEADFVESFVMHVDIAPLKAYASDSDTGIYKYELMTT